MQNLSSILSGVKMAEESTLAVQSKSNCVYKLLTVFQALLLFPCFGVKNAWNKQKYEMMDSVIKARKDVFYRVHSHLAHKSVLGFKCLCMAVTDGISQILPDFDIVGEKGKKGNYGMSTKEIARRHKTEHNGKVLQKREETYDISKIELAKDMIKRAVKRGVKFQYVLADSWFTCKDIVQFIHKRHFKCHWPGMIKVGENSKTLYQTEDGNHSAPTLVKLGKKQKRQKYSRKPRCFHMVYDARYGNVPVRIFLIRRTKNGKWIGSHN